jgi:glycosyltransferase involved in cell wall biosynthesis
VRRHGPADLLVMPHLPQAELASAYTACRVHALPSWAETCGLVNLEAGACGAAVVAGVLGYECEYLGDLADYCDPADVDSIAAAVRRAWDRRDPARADRLRRRVLDRFTWAETARATFDAYRRVLRRG